MIVDKYLVINSKGSVTVREREPRLAGNEISLRLRMDVPSAMFSRPQLYAEMKIPTEAVPKGKITTEITDNLSKIIHEATGLTMAVTVIEQELEDKKKQK